MACAQGGRLLQLAARLAEAFAAIRGSPPRTSSTAPGVNLTPLLIDDLDQIDNTEGYGSGSNQDTYSASNYRIFTCVMTYVTTPAPRPRFTGYYGPYPSYQADDAKKKKKPVFFSAERAENNDPYSTHICSPKSGPHSQALLRVGGGASDANGEVMTFDDERNMRIDANLFLSRTRISNSVIAKTAAQST